jgi:hypothetical protein
VINVILVVGTGGAETVVPGGDPSYLSETIVAEGQKQHRCTTFLSQIRTLYFSRDFAKSVLYIHFAPQFQTVVSPSILDRFA